MRVCLGKSGVPSAESAANSTMTGTNLRSLTRPTEWGIVSDNLLIYKRNEVNISVFDHQLPFSQFNTLI